MFDATSAPEMFRQSGVECERGLHQLDKNHLYKFSSTNQGSKMQIVGLAEEGLCHKRCALHALPCLTTHSGMGYLCYDYGYSLRIIA